MTAISLKSKEFSQIEALFKQDSFIHFVISFNRDYTIMDIMILKSQEVDLLNSGINSSCLRSYACIRMVLRFLSNNKIHQSVRSSMYVCKTCIRRHKIVKPSFLYTRAFFKRPYHNDFLSWKLLSVVDCCRWLYLLFLPVIHEKILHQQWSSA